MISRKHRARARARVPEAHSSLTETPPSGNRPDQARSNQGKTASPGRHGLTTINPEPERQTSSDIPILASRLALSTRPKLRKSSNFRGR